MSALNKTVATRPSNLFLWLMVGLVGLPSGASGQDKSPFFFYHKAQQGSGTLMRNIHLRPNASLSQFLFVKAPEDLRDAVVTLIGPDGKVWATSDKMSFDKAGDIKLVKFIKPEEKKSEEKKPAADPAKPPVPPPPPGKPLVITDEVVFTFKLDLYEEARKRRYTETINVTVLDPQEYFEAEAKSKPNGIKVVIKPKKEHRAFVDGKPSVANLVFPPQDQLNVESLGAGTYRRTIDPAEASAVLESDDLPITARQGDQAQIKFHLDIDGHPRAFLFKPTVSELRVRADSDSIKPDPKGDVRFYPGSGNLESGKTSYLRPLAKPDDRFPVRVELDNPVARSKVKITFERGGQDSENATRSKDENEELRGSRDTKVWLEPAGEDGQILVTSIVKDWVLPLDTFMMRGNHPLTAEFRDRNNDDVKKTTALVLDDTAPHRIVMDLSAEHIKGQPIKVSAMIADKESTPIKKVVFFVGPPPGPDGKRPADPVKVEGVRDNNVPDTWVAELPLAPEAKGVLQVGVVATNEVGLDGTETKNIKLVDAPAPAGNLHVKVLRGSRAQPDMEVKLLDAEGKEKSLGKSNDKGIVKFEKLAPGLYKVVAAKADSSSGSKGEVVGKVEVDKTTEVTLTLKRGQ